MQSFMGELVLAFFNGLLIFDPFEQTHDDFISSDLLWRLIARPGCFILSLLELPLGWESIGISSYDICRVWLQSAIIYDDYTYYVYFLTYGISEFN